MMKNRLLALFAVIALCFVMVLPVSATDVIGYIPGYLVEERTLPLVVDYADILTAEEEAVLESELYALGVANNLEIGVVTVDSCEGSDPQDFADDFYDYNGYGYGENDDGLIIVFNTGRDDGERSIALSTHGDAISLVSDAKMNEMFDEMIPLLVSGNYATAFDVFLIECEDAFTTSEDDYVFGDSGFDDFGTGNVNTNSGGKSLPLYYIPLSVVIGFVFAFIIVKIQASGLKNVRKKVDASGYVDNVDITASKDRFLYKNVNRSPRPKSTSSGSSHGGSVHRSSSGRSHGGGSRRF